MNTAASVDTVHGSETQHQLAWVKLSARIRYVGTNHEGVNARLLDLSVDGFAFITSGASIQPGDLYKDKLPFQTDGISLFLEVESQVRSTDPASRRVGRKFRNLKSCEVAALRYLITSYLADEVTGVGDVLNILQREGLTKACEQGGDNGGMDFFGRVRAVTLSTAVFVVGVGASAFILNQVCSLYFVTHADSDVVGVPSQQIAMPCEGTVWNLLGSNVEVAKGVSVAISSANLLDMPKGNLTEEQLNPGNIEELLGRQMKGTLTSPRDCRVVQQLVTDGQHVNKSQVIFTLAPRDSVTSIGAHFPYRNAAELAPDTRVNSQVAGDGVNRSGYIVSIAPVDGDLPSEIRVQTQPDQPPDVQRAGHPAGVSIGDLPGRTLLNRAVTLATTY